MGRRSREKKRKKKRQIDHSNSNSKFLSFLTQQNVNVSNPVSIHNFEETGRGMIATKNIKPGDTIVSIPSQLFITTESVAKSDFSSAIERSYLKLTPHEALSCFLTEEYLKGPSSSFHLYIQSLPISFNLTYFWKSKEVKQLPKFLQKDVDLQKKKVLKGFLKFLKIHRLYLLISSPITLNAPSLKVVEKEAKGLYRIYNWAYAIINSRSVYFLNKREGRLTWLDEKEVDNMALVPFLDMFNHSNSAEVEAGFDESINCFVIKTITPYLKNSQVFINYGCHDNKLLLMNYGFLSSENKYDVVEVEMDSLIEAYWEMRKNEKKNEEREAKKERDTTNLNQRVNFIRQNYLDQQMFIRRDEVSYHLVQSMNLVCFTNLFSFLQDPPSNFKNKKETLDEVVKDFLSSLFSVLKNKISSNSSHPSSNNGLLARRLEAILLQIICSLEKIYLISSGLEDDPF